MFPFDLDEEEIDVTVEEEKEPADYEIDFETGKLTGRIITGLEAIIQWVRIVLSTDRYFYTQYSWNYGSELNSLIGKNYSLEYVQSEVKRMLEEALLIDDNILGIEDIECKLENDRLSINFRINTIYGGSEISV